MNSDLGELLREAIDRATDGERLHPSLATRARQRHHRRTLTVRAAAVTGTVAVAAVAVFAATHRCWRRSTTSRRQCGPGSHGRLCDQPGGACAR
jgi:hypothetical protein